MAELCKLGRRETFGTTPVALPAAIGTVGDCRDCPDLTHNPEVAGARGCAPAHGGDRRAAGVVSDELRDNHVWRRTSPGPSRMRQQVATAAACRSWRRLNCFTPKRSVVGEVHANLSAARC